MTWRTLAVLAAMALLAGCLDDDAGSDSTSSGPPTGPAEVPHGSQLVLMDERFTASVGVPWTWQVSVPGSARNVVLDLTQDSGAIPNLHVELDGCGEADPPASASMQTVELCDEPSAGERTFSITVNAGLPAGNGRAVLRADLV